jgi:hypothetical protein
MDKMDPELKTKWLVALRSGEYKQGRSVLCGPDNNYCCLGVLAKVAGRLTDRGYFVDKEGEPASTVLLYSLKGYELVSAEAQGALAGMNDSDRASFNKIANWIEVNL